MPRIDFQSAGLWARWLGWAAASVWGARPKVQPIEAAPQLRAVRMSTSESPIMMVWAGVMGSPAIVEASAMRARRPWGSGFLVWKLLPP